MLIAFLFLEYHQIVSRLAAALIESFISWFTQTPLFYLSHFCTIWNSIYCFFSAVFERYSIKCFPTTTGKSSFRFSPFFSLLVGQINFLFFTVFLPQSFLFIFHSPIQFEFCSWKFINFLFIFINFASLSRKYFFYSTQFYPTLLLGFLVFSLNPSAFPPIGKLDFSVESLSEWKIWKHYIFDGTKAPSWKLFARRINLGKLLNVKWQ